MLLVVGDSLSAAYGMAAAEGWVARLEARLAAAGYRYDVINASVSGDTTRGALARLPRALAQHKPRIVIIELGGNDGLRGLPLEVMRDNLAAMIELCQRSGAQVLLLGIRLPANYGADYAEKFHALYGELARRYRTGLVPFFLAGIALDPDMFQADGIHPGVEAQARLLDNVWPHLLPLLEK